MMIRLIQPSALRDSLWRFWRWRAIPLLLVVASLCLFTSTAQAAQVTVTRPTGWESWPPSRYNADWLHQGPTVTRIYDGAHFNWLAATFAVRFNAGRIELWRDFGAGAALLLDTPAEVDAPVYLMVHPWRGPHIVYFANSHTLAAIYPVDYYVLQAGVLSESTYPEDWLGLDVARNGPVIIFYERDEVRAATYYGLGYQVVTPDNLLRPQDATDFAVDREGDFVLAYQHGRKLYVQQFREGQGWVREQMRNYSSPGDWQLTGNKGNVKLRYQTRRGWDEWSSLTGDVIRQWWF